LLRVFLSNSKIVLKSIAMKTIEIDNEVYQALEKQVRGFEDTPNIVLRRILGLSGSSDVKPHVATATPKVNRTKAPKVDLETLARVGSISDGERLSFRDYQQNKVNGVEATIHGKQLEYEEKRYSMSALARKIMRKQGYANESYRGPIFWYTNEGKSIHDLWQSYLNSNDAR
jgi:hypothetical protein